MTIVCGDSHAPPTAPSVRSPSASAERGRARPRRRRRFPRPARSRWHPGRRSARPQRHGEEHDPRGHRVPRHGGRISHVIGHRHHLPVHLDGRPDDGVHMSIEAVRTGRNDRAGRHDLRLARGSGIRRRTTSARRRGAGGRCPVATVRSGTPVPSSTGRWSCRRSRGAPSPVRWLPSTVRVPDPAGMAERQRNPQERALRSLEYMELKPGTPINAIKLDRHGVHRLVHQQPHRGPARAAAVMRGVPSPCHACMVVPGSHTVKAQAEAEGLHDVFRAAGAELARGPGARCAWR